MCSEDLQDELLSINAIYGDDTFAHIPQTQYFSLRITVSDPHSDPPVEHSDTPTAHPHAHVVVLKLSIPAQYPLTAPRVAAILSVGDSQALKGQGAEIVESATAVLQSVFVMGQPLIADLIEGVEQIIKSLLAAGVDTLGSHDTPSSLGVAQEEHGGAAEDVVLGAIPEWIVSDPLVERKSVFVARLVRVDSVDEAKRSLAHLLLTDKKTGKATHNISAWRIKSGGAQYQDCDDDGESAAGGRLLHLLQLTDVWGVMVVVSRWYGGVHLGPARFKLINSAARDVLVTAGLVEHGHGGAI